MQLNVISFYLSNFLKNFKRFEISRPSIQKNSKNKKYFTTFEILQKVWKIECRVQFSALGVFLVWRRTWYKKDYLVLICCLVRLNILCFCISVLSSFACAFSISLKMRELLLLSHDRWIAIERNIILLIFRELPVVFVFTYYILLFS